MLYKELLKKIKTCPFCNGKNRLIVEYETAYLTYALAPYTKDHLLIVPKRHVVHFLKLNAQEKNEIDALIEYGVKMLEMAGYKNYTVLVRNGTKSMKSVPHLHYHIIPNHRIGDLDINGEQRGVMTIAEIKALMKKFSQIAKKIKVIK